MISITKNSVINRVWQSPTITTWLSYSTQTLSLIVVLPLVLSKFSPGDVVLWYLFASILSLQGIADFGFRQTFVRVISYAYSGIDDIDFYNKSKIGINTFNEPNVETLTKIISMMNWIYLRLAFVLFFLLIGFGSLAMINPIRESSNETQSWTSWAIVLLSSCISFFGKKYLNFLEGLFKIALVRRVEIFTSLGNISCSILVLIYYPSLLNLILVSQCWLLIVVLRDWILCRKIDDGIFKRVSKKTGFDKKFFDKLWRPAWRSGISGFMSVGLTNFSGIIYAQIGSPTTVASFLLAVRFIEQIKTVSMAPLYSKIPLLARLRVENNIEKLRAVVAKGMVLSHFVYVCGFIIIGVFSQFFLVLIHSKVPFVDQKLWILIGVAYFIHRYGAMHIQVYLSTNHVISHIADGISGLIFVISAIILSKYLGAYSIPIAMILGYLGFYSWYAASHSYRSMNVSFWSFERKVSLIPLCILLMYSIYYFRL